MPVTVNCIECGVAQEVTPTRAKTFRCCGFPCRTAWRAKHWSGTNNPAHKGGERSKFCQHCGKVFSHKRKRPYVVFQRQKFCSKACADVGGVRHSGPDNGNWNGNPRRKHRESKHAAWARNVISRDGGKCAQCGSKESLHAHHVKPYKEHPEIRWDVSNGLTVCAPCHWKIHAVDKANGVNSGKAVAGKAAGNPEPSFGRKPVEGVTTSGRAYRRWEGACDNCGSFLSRRWSDVVGKRHMFCSKTCMGTWRAANEASLFGRPRR